MWKTKSARGSGGCATASADPQRLIESSVARGTNRVGRRAKMLLRGLRLREPGEEDNASRRDRPLRLATPGDPRAPRDVATPDNSPSGSRRELEIATRFLERRDRNLCVAQKRTIFPMAWGCAA